MTSMLVMNETLLTTNAAGEWLHEAVPGESPAYWRQALINNRRPDRSPPHRVPFNTLGRAAVYTPEALQAFADFEKSRRLGQIKLTGRAAEVVRAFGIGEASGTTQGRAFKGASANLASGPSGAFVQTIINEPLLVFMLTADQAVALGKELLDAGQAAMRINGAASK